MDVSTQAHLTTLRDLLLYRRRELASEIRAADLLRQDAAFEVGAAELSTRDDGAARHALDDVDAAQEQRDRDELAQVDAALARLDQGTYGDCIECAEPIPTQRLLVQPAATRCAACQVAFEHRPGGAAHLAAAG